MVTNPGLSDPLLTAAKQVPRFASEIKSYSTLSSSKEVCMYQSGYGFGLFRVPFLLTLFLFFGVTVLAQSTATVQGTVSDPKGAVIPGASVIVRNEATSLERTTQTDPDGNYQLAALPVGNYRVEVRVQGFKTNVID